MAKRNVKKVSKSKPVHFSSLNLNQKVFAVILIVLAIGVISSAFPGEENITGMAAFEGIFDMMKDVLSGINDLVVTIFKQFFGTEETTITYARFILFALVVSLIFLIVKQFTDNSLIGFAVGIAIAYLTTFFIPMGAILASGILYSGFFMVFLLLGPAALLAFLLTKLKKTKTGYILKFIILFLMYVFISSLGKGGEFAQRYGASVGTIRNGLIAVIVVWMLWAIYRFFTVKVEESMTKEAIEGLRDRVDLKIAEWIANLGKPKKP